MDINLIEALAGVLNKNQLHSLEVEEGGLRIRLEAKQEEQESHACVTRQAVNPVAVQEVPDDLDTDPGMDFNQIDTVDSPMIGVFYTSPSPDAEAYVQVGSKIKKGDVLCIIEAMKLMNEIVAEKSGEIVDICVSNGDVVEYGQPLFKIF
ncbi:MAG: acetyl-CoA carboxylase biotin carboxyl carrier protein [Christensenellales bacterium]|jgi:acetyl-CoA carboxylase biotin carboxyl carrier protein